MLLNGFTISAGEVAGLARRCAGTPALAQRLGLAVDTLAANVWVVGAERKALLTALQGPQDLALAGLREHLADQGTL